MNGDELRRRTRAAMATQGIDPADVAVAPPVSDEEKLSARILSVAAPFLDHASDRATKADSVAIVAWSVSQMSGTEREQHVHQMLANQQRTSQDLHQALQLIDFLIE